MNPNPNPSLLLRIHPSRGFFFLAPLLSFAAASVLNRFSTGFPHAGRCDMGEIKVRPCKGCGKPTTNFTKFSKRTAELLGKRGVAYCDECRAELRREREWANEQYQATAAICPWCLHPDTDSWEIEDGATEHECPRCGRAYELEVERVYTTRRRIDDMPDGYEPDGGPWIGRKV